MTSNNEQKTEIFLTASKRNLKRLSNITLTIGDAKIDPSPTIQNLWVVFDPQNMSMSSHVNTQVRTCNLLNQPQWLSVTEQIMYKILLLVYKCLHNCTPVYLIDLLNDFDTPKNAISFLPRIYQDSVYIRTYTNSRDSAFCNTAFWMAYFSISEEQRLRQPSKAYSRPISTPFMIHNPHFFLTLKKRIFLKGLGTYNVVRLPLMFLNASYMIASRPPCWLCRPLENNKTWILVIKTNLENK